MTGKREIFGTDGVRGLANAGAMTPESMLALGMAVGRVFKNGAHRHRVVIGKDTRLSGYMVESALVAGFMGVGVAGQSLVAWDVVDDGTMLADGLVAAVLQVGAIW